LSCLCRIMDVVARSASRGAERRRDSQDSRSLSVPMRRIPVVYEHRWVSELFCKEGRVWVWRFVGGRGARREP
jgi:hypothetical protein